MMTRKHYQAFASAMKALRDDPRTERRTWEQIVLAIAGIFKADNPRFDFNRFYKACGYVLSVNRTMPQPYYPPKTGGENEQI